MSDAVAGRRRRTEKGRQVAYLPLPKWQRTTRANPLRGMLIAVALALPVASPAAAQDILLKQIQLAIDHPIRLRGAFRGNNLVDYRFDATEGTGLSLEMQTDNPGAHFDLQGPTSAADVPDKAIFVGSVSGMKFTGRIPRSGVYVIRLSLERDAARRNEEAYYRLDIRLAGMAGPTQRSEEDVTSALSGGADEWRVVGFKAESALNIRAAPSAQAEIVARARNGDVLKKGGCRMAGQISWCRVITQDGVEGWAAERLLGE